MHMQEEGALLAVVYNYEVNTEFPYKCARLVLTFNSNTQLNLWIVALMCG